MSADKIPNADVTQLIAEARDAAAREHFQQCREIDSLRSQLSERDARVAELESDDWRPTAANVNALPLRIRQYVGSHDGLTSGRANGIAYCVSIPTPDECVPKDTTITPRERGHE